MLYAARDLGYAGFIAVTDSNSSQRAIAFCVKVVLYVMFHNYSLEISDRCKHPFLSIPFFSINRLIPIFVTNHIFVFAGRVLNFFMMGVTLYSCEGRQSLSLFLLFCSGTGSSPCSHLHVVPHVQLLLIQDIQDFAHISKHK